MKGAAAVPASVRLQGKPLKDWSNADVVEWAQEKYPKVVQFLANYDGSDLALWKKEDFKEIFGIGIGAAFYNCLEDAGLLKTVLPEQPAPPGASTQGAISIDSSLLLLDQRLCLVLQVQSRLPMLLKAFP